MFQAAPYIKGASGIAHTRPHIKDKSDVARLCTADARSQLPRLNVRLCSNLKQIVLACVEASCKKRTSSRTVITSAAGTSFCVTHRLRSSAHRTKHAFSYHASTNIVKRPYKKKSSSPLANLGVSFPQARRVEKSCFGARIFECKLRRGLKALGEATNADTEATSVARTRAVSRNAFIAIESRGRIPALRESHLDYSRARENAMAEDFSSRVTELLNSQAVATALGVAR